MQNSSEVGLEELCIVESNAFLFKILWFCNIVAQLAFPDLCCFKTIPSWLDMHSKYETPHL